MNIKKTILTLITALLLISSFTSMAEIRSGSYARPSLRVDGSSLSPEEIAGYNVYVDGVVIVNPEYKYTLEGDATTFSVEVLPGNHVLTVTTHDTEGRESTMSSEITVTAKSPPNPPVIDSKTTITIIINNN